MLASLILFAGVMVVVVKNIIHAALWLIASFAGVAALYFLLEAPFIGVVQILVYAGAVSILVLFAIMLTRQITGERTRQLFERWWVAAIVALGLLLVIVRTVSNPGLPTSVDQSRRWPQRDLVNTPAVVVSTDPAGGTAQATTKPAEVAGAFEIGESFMREFLLPFEIASILLLVALIGAVVIAYEERSRRRRVLTLAEETALRRSIKGVGLEPLQALPPVNEQAGASTVGLSAGTTNRR